MLSGSSLNKMLDVMPDRVFDVGIEQQTFTLSTFGLATQRNDSFCNIYSTFIKRNDQDS